LAQSYHNTSIQDLADAPGVQKVSLISCIESKDEWLRRLLERVAS